MTDSNPVCMDHNRFRKIRLIADHYCIADESDSATEIFDCIAWNKNLSANNCFVPGDVIALTGEYHKTGKRRKSISVTLQIQNIYIEGEKSANAYPTYYPNYRASKKKQANKPHTKKAKPSKPEKKQRYFVYVGDTKKAG